MRTTKRVNTGPVVIYESVVDTDVLKWRLGMAFASAFQFLLITVAVRYLGPLAARHGLGSGNVVWLARHYWIALVVWLACVAVAWWAIRFSERVVTMLMIVAHVAALAAVLYRILV